MGAPCASAKSLRASITGEIHKAQDYIANLIQNDPRHQISQANNTLTTYAQAAKGNIHGHMVSNTDPDAVRRLQITVKSSNIAADHPIHSADSTGIVEAFNNAIADTVKAADSNIITPITARSARRLKSGDLTVVLHSQNDVDSIRNNSKEWLPRFAPGAS
ncbi:hypothetical protein R3P38DRAFT_3209737 [Favolaschia claudopus]|uniref:Uncharacterized protein n=1 Tax=Favolaschia claudopus TaxID=2862362 RepID=A0AAW0AI69_9AGAR